MLPKMKSANALGERFGQYGSALFRMGARLHVCVREWTKLTSHVKCSQSRPC
jgi:hypothetical protein